VSSLAVLRVPGPLEGKGLLQAYVGPRVVLRGGPFS
jgi:hypothetical protein